MIKTICAAFAFVCFAIGFSGKAPAYNWISGGLMFLTAAVFLAP
jgi:hypothetical protein